jgi:hypothetical protein
VPSELEASGGFESTVVEELWIALVSNCGVMFFMQGIEGNEVDYGPPACNTPNNEIKGMGAEQRPMYSFVHE